MEIKFELDGSKRVKIIGTDEKTKESHMIGHIFTPSGSGNDSKNAIQVCGFTEAFDLWGCGLFKMPKTKEDHYVYERRGKVFEQAKDIQLMFSFETEAGAELHSDYCWSCYNYPCTCEVRAKYHNPFVVKREQDLYIEKKEKKVKKDG